MFNTCGRGELSDQATYKKTVFNKHFKTLSTDIRNANSKRSPHTSAFKHFLVPKLSFLNLMRYFPRENQGKELAKMTLKIILLISR